MNEDTKADLEAFAISQAPPQEEMVTMPELADVLKLAPGSRQVLVDLASKIGIRIRRAKGRAGRWANAVSKDEARAIIKAYYLRET